MMSHGTKAFCFGEERVQAFSSDADDQNCIHDKPVPIAVIGYSVRFPQEADSSEGFWRMLVEGRSARTEIPKERFNIDAFHHPDVKRQASLNTREGHFLKGDLAAFDAPFFSITPGEAASMDPQQRGLLETAYRALENAGIPMAEVAGSRTSVHIGSFSHDWQEVLKSDPLMHVDYEATGSEVSMLANRLSWFYDLAGPSISLDTACSSSLMALHLACQSLKNGETNMGLVGGANIILDPRSMISMGNLGMLSPEGKCYSFDHRANGYARGEGFGVVVIKRLSDALKAGDSIRAIIRATGTNQDGKTPGITQPNGSAQERLIRETYEAAGLERKVTRYFEAHGTGTPVGDPTEAKAIATAFAGQRPQGERLYVGSVKTNIGHLEGTSGIASLIKTILVLENGLIPPNIWFDKANSKILEDEWNIKFPTENTPWPSGGLRRASVNSFGLGGSNVHVVLDDVGNYLRLHGLGGAHNNAELHPLNAGPSGPLPMTTLQKRDGFHNVQEINQKLFVWSAADEHGLRRMTSLYASHLSNLKPVQELQEYLRNLAFTLFSKRSSLRWKSFVVADSIQGVSQALKQQMSKPVRSTSKRKIGFVFTGQGAQWHAMGKELVSFPVFRQSFHDMDGILGTIGCRWSLLDELSQAEDDTNVHKPAYSQPLCTALQIALVDLLWSWNIRPSTVLGHSSGEIAAAYCAGALSRQSALRIAFYRGYVATRIASRSRRQGAMMSVGLSEEEVEPYLTKSGPEIGTEDVVIACINSPRNITLSGGEKQMDKLKLSFDQKNVTARKLKVDVAYHSTAMNEVALEYGTLIKGITTGEQRSDRPAVFSSVTGSQITVDELSRVEYWVRNMTSKVKFSEAFMNLCSQSSRSSTKKLGAQSGGIAVTDLLEIGPHSALQRPIKDILNMPAHSRSMTYKSLLARGVSAITSSLSTVGHLHCLGYAINLLDLNHPVQERSRLQVLSDLPEYPFDHSHSYWAESRLSKNFRFRKQSPHELLGTRVPDWNALEARWRHKIRLSETPWIGEHKVNGIELYPAAGLLVMAIEAAKQVASKNQSITGYRLTDVTFPKPLMSLSGEDAFETQLFLRANNTRNGNTLQSSEFRIYTYQSDDWVENCQGTIVVEHTHEDAEVDCGRENSEQIRQYKRIMETGTMRCRTAIEPEQLYERLENIGISYGPAFRVLHEVRYNHHESIGTVHLRQWAATVIEGQYQNHVIHPTALDGLLQVSFPAVLEGVKSGSPTMVPSAIRSLWISSQGLSQGGEASIKAYANVIHRNFHTADCMILALDSVSEVPRIIVKGLRATVVGGQQALSSSIPHGWKRLCYSFDWRPDVDLLSKQELQTYCKVKTPAVLPRDSLIEDMEFMCFTFLTKVLMDLDRKDITLLKPHFQRYIESMKRQTERYNRGEMFYWKPDWPALGLNRDHVATVIGRVENRSAEGKLYAEIGRNLLDILEGRTDVLNILFDGDLAAEYYRETDTTQLIGPYLDILAHKNSGLRILEIGAGTGTSTATILQTLMQHGEGELGAPRYGRYTFTDISPGFFEKAKERFKIHADRMVFATLDIEQDPLQQGFEEGGYDLIVAANVLHATSDLRLTLLNTRKLVRPGGKLILGEFFNPEVSRIGFVFGLLPGWWISTEENRKKSPLISETDWNTVLGASSFSGTDIVLHDHDEPRSRMGNVMVSTAVTPSQRLSEIPKITIVASNTSEIQPAVICQIQAQLARMGISRCEVLDFDQMSPESLKGSFCIFLPEIENPILQNISEQDYVRLQCLFKSSIGLLWLTYGGGRFPEKPEADMILGLSRCIRSENSNVRLITLALHTATNAMVVAQYIARVVKETFYTGLGGYETEYEEIDGRLCINRAVEANYLNDYLFSSTGVRKSEKRNFEQPGRGLELRVGSPGMLDSMEYVEDLTFPNSIAKDEVEIKVKAVGINFKDILIALGRLSEGGLGNECAGIVTRAGSNSDLVSGDRVCMCTLDTYKTYVRCGATTVFKIPDTMSFCEAAAYPIVYITAYQALHENAHLAVGESVLIHSGAGGTGQAAIQLAKLQNADIYVTVGSNEKKRLIMDLYNIPEDHIFASRGMTFTKGIKRMTQGRGVDVILNSLSGESLEGSWDCLAPFGRFVEIGKKDILEGNKLPMLPFNENRTYTALNITHMTSERPAMIRKTMKTILSLVRDGKIRTPQPLHIYKNSQIEDAFRYLQGGTNTGKTVLEFNEEDIVSVVPSSRPHYTLTSEGTYVISGGLGGLGRRVARWMVDRGATNLILLSRSGANSDDVRKFVDELQVKGVHVATPSCDVSDEHSLRSVLTESSRMLPPIKGCVQASMVLEDSLFDNMSLKAFTAATKPKVNGSWNLHKILPNGVDFFILLSSATGAVGVRGQANYASGNTYQDALARHRTSIGEKAISLDLGPILEFGYAAERPQVLEAMKKLGSPPIHEAELLSLLEYYCNPSLELSSSSKSQVIIGLGTPASMRAQGLEEPYWMQRPQFKALHQMDTISSTASNHADNIVKIPSLLSAAGTIGEFTEIVSEALIQKMSRILSMPLDNIDPSRPIHFFGVDSLVAVEIRNWFSKEVDGDVTVFEILGNESISDLVLGVARKSRYGKVANAES